MWGGGRLSRSVLPHSLGFHGLQPTRILEWVAISYSRGFSRPRDPTHNSCVKDVDSLPLSHLGSPVNLLLCLIYQLNHIGMYVRKKNTVYIGLSTIHIFGIHWGSQVGGKALIILFWLYPLYLSLLRGSNWDLFDLRRQVLESLGVSSLFFYFFPS